MSSSLYTGREYHRNVGLYDYRNRAYNADLGRFLQRDPPGNWYDPVNFGNAYAYVGGDPGNGRDPWGLKRLQMDFDFGEHLDEDGADFFEPNGTKHIKNIDEIFPAMKAAVEPYSSDGIDPCNCVEILHIMGHGGAKTAALPMGKDVFVTARDIQNLDSNNIKLRILTRNLMAKFTAELIKIGSLMCSGGKIYFGFCHSGKGEEGKVIRDYIKSLLPTGVEGILPQGDCGWSITGNGTTWGMGESWF